MIENDALRTALIGFAITIGFFAVWLAGLVVVISENPVTLWTSLPINDKIFYYTLITGMIIAMSPAVGSLYETM